MTRKEVYALELNLANERKLSLKKIKFFRGHDGMTGLSCDLYVDGKKVAYCFDDARGGEMEITPYTAAHRFVINSLEDDLHKLPAYQCEDFNFEMNHDLESLVNALAQKYEEDKEFEKNSRKGILYKDANDSTWVFGWKYNLPMYIAMYKEKAIQNIKDACSRLEGEGNVILNKDYIKTLGIEL